MSGCVSCFLVSFAACFIAFIDPAIDRRIIYNDFRSNPYLHFGAGFAPRVLGVQLGEFHLFYLFVLFVRLLLFTYYVSLYHLIVDYMYLCYHYCL